MEIIFLIPSVYPPASINQAKTCKKITVKCFYIKIYPTHAGGDQEKKAKTKDYDSHAEVHHGPHQDITFLSPVRIFVFHFNRILNRKGQFTE
jgi:hypothetical protein